MSSLNTRRQQKRRGVPPAALQDHASDHAHHEVAATLMTVANGGAPAPASLLRLYRSDNTTTVHNTASPRASSSSPTANQIHPLNSGTHHHTMPHYTTLFSSIGFGIDLAGNGTDACCKALRDATERGKLNTTPLAASQYQFHIQLGVPGLPAQSPGVPQNIDTAKLSALLPSHIPKHFEVQCGGLLVPDSAGGGIEKASCVVVASLTMRQKNPSPPVPQASAVTVESTTSVANSPTVLPHHHAAALSPQSKRHGRPLPSSHVEQMAAAASVPRVPATWAEVEELMQQQQEQEHEHVSYQPLVRQPTQAPTRNKSIEMLARISAEMIGQEKEEASQARSMSYEFPGATSSLSLQQQDEDDRRPNTIYKKLPPGTTPKNHKRLFVKHSYRDHSHEIPLPEELDLVGPLASTHTPNAAFPLKLHEILSEIEADGQDDIIGWLPHGRSFKIHKQKEFVDKILPNYFIMTKKSSFLRQLNLYGFNRLSQVGDDQGSYYHEKFLRGMKFLSRRMQRQKVNGNGIRAAGNPDEEPNLFRFPTCPPVPIQNMVREHAPSHEYLQMYQRVHEKAHHQHIHGHHDTAASNNGAEGHLEATTTTSLLAHSGASRLVNGGPASAAVDNHHEQAALVLHRMQDSSNENNKETGQSTGSILSNANNSNNAGSIQASFPLKLQRILDKLEAEGNTDILSWTPHGRAFIVHDPDRFVTEIMPEYFNQTKYSSFQRQCHMYQFERITAGPDKNAYHNANFLRGRPDLASRMQRTRVNGKGTRRPGNPLKEPDFYSLPVLPPIARGTVIEIPIDAGTGTPTSDGGSAVVDGAGQEGSSMSGSGDENE